MTSCEWTLKDDDKNDGLDIVVKMKELIMKNDMEYKLTIIRRKNTLKTVHLMKDNYEKSIEVHNKLMLNVDEQQYDIKNLK